MRRFILFCLSVAMMLPLSSPAFAQKVTDVTVKLLEDGSNEPLGFATVSLTAKNATRVYKYTITNDKGSATFSEVKNGTYVLKAELMGYLPLEKEFTVKDNPVNLGSVTMKLDTQALDAASVSAVGNPIVIKKDTIEYNASSFKTTETDVLEDLLKKLPGVEVGTDGSITANGQNISKVYIDGKTFFMNDPQVASKNLPAKMINKVKVVKKKSDQAEFTGIEDGEEETVLDLSVQRGMMDGLMGNVNLGAGHDIPASTSGLSEDLKAKVYNDARYSGNLFMGKFSDGKQFSLIGNANNGGNVGFGGREGMAGMGGGHGGVTTSYMIGTNVGANLLDNKMELTGNYSLNGMNNDSWNKSYTENLFDTYTRYQNDDTQSFSNSLGHRIGMRIKHDFSKSSSLIFEPNINFSRGDNTSLQMFDTDIWMKGEGMERTKEKEGFSFNGGESQNVSASGRLQYRQRLGIPGRTLVVNGNFNLSDNRTDGYTQSKTDYFQGGVLNNTDIINQRNKQGSTSQSASVRMNYTEPLGNYFYVEASYNLNWSHSQSYKDAYDGLFDPSRFVADVFDNYSPRKDQNPLYNVTGEVRNFANSNDIINDNLRQTAGLELLYQSTKLRAQVGFNIIPTRIHNKTDRETYQIDTTYKILNWSPTAMVIWDPTNSTNIRINYRGNSSQPSVSQLVPVLDNSNPVAQSLGNPYLNPSFSHNISIEDRYTNRQRFSSYNIRLNGGFQQDPVVNATWSRVGEKQYSMPVNGPTSGNVGVNFFGNFPIKRSNFSINTSTGANARFSASYTGTNVETEKYLIRNADGEVTDFNYPKFREDYADIDASKDFGRNDVRSLSVNERFTLQYRSDALEVRLGAGTTYQNTEYSLRPEDNLITWSNNANLSLVWDVESIGLKVRPDFNYRWYNGFRTERPSEAVFNATLEKNVFKNRATIALRAYDILGQTKSFSVTDSANIYRETYSNTVGRYIIASLQWRFGTFGGGRGGRGGRGGFGGGMPMGGMGGMGGGRGRF